MHALRLGDVRSVLCLGAHPDDIEIGCGGGLLRLLEEQPDIHVHWVVFSGTAPRDREAREGAKTFLGGACSATVVVEDFADSLFPYDGPRLKKALRDIRQDISPDVIFTHRRTDLHQDHQLVADMTWHTFRDHLILEYEIPKYEGDLGTPNVYAALSEETCRRKVNGIVATFRSQAEKPWFSAETFWALLRLRGVECNSPSGFAEAYYGRKIRL